MKELKAGVFTMVLIDVPTGRWRAVNTLTKFEHITYGSQKDVATRLEKQSLIWEAKFEPVQKPKQRGSAWRKAPPPNE